MAVLGIWDGHDSGVAVVEGRKILFAANEERFTRRKNDVGFPVHSIRAACIHLSMKPGDFEEVAASSSDIGKTVSRVIPGIRQHYYSFRRRKMSMPAFVDARRLFKYKITELRPNAVSRKISEWHLRKALQFQGIVPRSLQLFDHHACHAACAGFAMGKKKSLVVTLDGLGDGLSGSVSVFHKGEYERLSAISSRDSLGIFFEQVTNLLGMRELEDEGKVMALADYSYPAPEEKNPFLDFFSVQGLRVKAKYSVERQYSLLRKMLWNVQREQYAHYAQKTLETHALRLFQNGIAATGIRDVAWSGGVASNIKMNMLIKPLTRHWFVFPHMGDGGQALGSAFLLNHQLHGIKAYPFSDVYYGPEYSEEQMKASAAAYGVECEYDKHINRHCGDLIADGNIVLRFSGRSEYGPRALGNRSILAPADDIHTKNALNIILKKRDWFQPFCPTVLEEEAGKFFTDVQGIDRFMTMGYQTKERMRSRVAAVINVDGTARPQMLGAENPSYRVLIQQVKKRTGDGIVLNTSFNIHGSPLINTPDEAIACFKETKSKYLALGQLLITKKR